MLLGMQRPNTKATLLTTVWCAAAGGIADSLQHVDVKNGFFLFWIVPPVLFAFAVLMAFRKIVKLTVLRLILMPVLMWCAFYVSTVLLSVVITRPELWLVRAIGWLLYAVPGLLAIGVVRLLLKVHTPLLNILCSGICSTIALFISFKIGDKDATIVGPIFLIWQTLVGFSFGLINHQNDPSLDN
jgi:uncharacterized membrane protein (UPF0136 family)